MSSEGPFQDKLIYDPVVVEHLQLDGMTSDLVAQPVHVYSSSFFLSSFYQCFCWTIRISKNVKEVFYGRNTTLERKFKQMVDYESMQGASLPLPCPKPRSCSLFFTQQAHMSPKEVIGPSPKGVIQSGEYTHYGPCEAFPLPRGKHTFSLNSTVSGAEVPHKQHPSLSA